MSGCLLERTAYAIVPVCFVRSVSVGIKGNIFTYRAIRSNTYTDIIIYIVQLSGRLTPIPERCLSVGPLPDECEAGGSVPTEPTPW